MGLVNFSWAGVITEVKKNSNSKALSVEAIARFDGTRYSRASHSKGSSVWHGGVLLWIILCGDQGHSGAPGPVAGDTGDADAWRSSAVTGRSRI